MFNWDLRQYLGMRGVGGKKEEACYGDELFVEVETHVVNILNQNWEFLENAFSLRLNMAERL